MASNPYVNKVIFGNETIIDISEDTVTPNDVLLGKSFHGASGTPQTGALSIGDYVTEEELRDTVGWTCKNLLDISSDVVTQTIDGITFTVTRDSDGKVAEIDLNGTCTNAGGCSFLLKPWEYHMFDEGEYILSDEAGMPYPNNPYTVINRKLGESGTVSEWNTGKSDGSHTNRFEIDYSEYDYFRVIIYVPTNVTCNHIKFYPMLRKASISDSTYEPYHESVDDCKYNRSEANVLGAKNILPKGETSTHNDVTFSVASDGKVAVNGTASSTAFWAVPIYLPAGKYIMSGCPSGGGTSTYRLDIRDGKGGSTTSLGEIIDSGSGVQFTVPSAMTVYVNIRVASGYSASSVVFSPMIRLATDTDSTYRPYAMTNKELTDDVTSISEQVDVMTNYDDLNLHDTVGWVSKNLLPFRLGDFRDINTDGSWSSAGGVHYTLNGVTFRTTSEGNYISSITLSGTATANTIFWLAKNNDTMPFTQGNKFIINGGVDYPSQYGCYMGLDVANTSGTGSKYWEIFSSKDKVIDIDTSYPTYDYNMYIYVGVNNNVDGMVFKPMIRKYGVVDPTFYPYHESMQSYVDRHRDGWTAVQQVSNGQVTFTGLDDTQGWGYKPFFNVGSNSTNKNPSYSINSITGSGTSNMTVVYDTDADSGSNARLRIIKN